MTSTENRTTAQEKHCGWTTTKTLINDYSVSPNGKGYTDTNQGTSSTNEEPPLPSVDQFSSQFYQVESACDLDQAKLFNLYKIIG